MDRPRLTESSFPPRPRTLRGRRRELAVLEAFVRDAHPAAIALVGTGGSGKSTLAAALGHRVRDRFPGGLHWFRLGNLGLATVSTMLALRLGVSRGRPLAALARRFRRDGATFVVLDNHENDAVTASLLTALAGVPVTWVITARRCLLGGVRLYPVSAPLSVAGAPPFPSVAALTTVLRHNPVALSMADAAVRDGLSTEAGLASFLERREVGRVRVIADEDDLPEVRLMVDFVWQRLSRAERAILAVLAHMGGDHMDGASIEALIEPVTGAARALARLRRLSLIEEPFEARYSLHATIRRAVAPRTRFEPDLLFRHYVSLLEGSPERLDFEQTHLFAAMDHAQLRGSLGDRVRLEALLRRLGL